MERRNFVKTGVLTGIGISILPFSLVANGINEKRISSSIISAENHVRHGLYNDDVGSVHHLSDWLKNFKKDVFHKNGISASKEDMVNLSFKLDGQKIKVHKLEMSILTITDNGSARHDVGEENEITIFEDAHYDCRIINFNKNHIINLNKEHFLLPLENDISIDGSRITKNEILFLDREEASAKKSR